MTSDLYEHVSWGDGPVDVENLQKMVSNSDYLYEHQINGYFSMLGIVRETGLTFRIGHAKLINTEDQQQVANVYFNRPFLPGMRPAIFHSLQTSQHNRIYIGTRGLDGRAIADHRGFHLIASQDETDDTEFSGEQYVSYFAIAPSG